MLWYAPKGYELSEKPKGSGIHKIALGLVVGRLQHDGLIGWKELNRLKQQVDLSWVLQTAEAVEETWSSQHQATEAVMKDLNIKERRACERVRKAAAGGAILTNGREGRQMRIEPATLAAWRLQVRDRDLDAEDRDEQDEAA